jgi:hypothetical protein
MYFINKNSLPSTQKEAQIIKVPGKKEDLTRNKKDIKNIKI